MVEKTVGSGNTQIVYGPQGRFATMNGQTLVKAFVPLPGAQAVYTSSGLAYYRHADHLGSSCLATTPSRTLFSSTAYAPYGEPYSQSGTTDLSFTGQDQDTVSGIHDFLMRKYVPVQGRWLSPDPAGLAAVNPGNPQSWNRYAYVGNSPLDSVDPLGLVTSNAAPCPGGTGWSFAPDGSHVCWVPGQTGPDLDFDCPPWLVMDSFTGACVAPPPADPVVAPGGGGGGGGGGGNGTETAKLGAIAGAPDPCKGLSPFGLIYAPDTRGHIEQGHMNFLVNGAGTPPQNGAGQYIFTPQGTADQNWLLVKVINSMTVSLGKPQYQPLTGNYAVTAGVPMQAIDLFGNSQ